MVDHLEPAIGAPEPRDRIQLYAGPAFPSSLAKVGARGNVVTIDAELKPDSSGVRYALGGFSGGLALWVENGKLSFEYNLFEVERTRIETTDPLPTGMVRSKSRRALRSRVKRRTSLSASTARRLPRAGRRARQRSLSPPTMPLTSAWMVIRRYRWPISTALRSSSTARSTR
jgi:hypothetical protein